MKRRSMLAKSLAVMGAPAVISPARAADETIRVGLFLTYSGPSGTSGLTADNLIKVFQKRYGMQAGGRTIELVKRDTGGPNPAQARQVMQELLTREKVKIMIGPDFTPNVMAVTPLVTEAKVPMFVAGAATTGIIERSPFLVRTMYNSQQVARPLAHWAYKNNIRRIVTVVADFAPGHEIEALLSKAYKEVGGTVVDTMRVPVRNPEFSGYLQRIKEVKPDAVYLFMPIGELGPQFLKAFVSAGLRDAGIKLLADGGVTDETVLDATGDAAMGVVTVGVYSSAHESVLHRQVLADYTALFGKQALRPGLGGVAVWDAMRLIYDGVAAQQQEAAFDPVKFMAFVRGRSFESPRGPVTVDKQSGEMIQNVYLRRVVRKNGAMINDEFEFFKDEPVK